MAQKRMSKQDMIDWEELYTYVKNNVMGYDENQSLSKDMVLRLKGLLTGKFIENNNIKDNSNYSYKTILNTFKFCYPSIQKALRTVPFNNEQHKFLYITKIVENNINDVYIKMRDAEKAKEEAKNKIVELPVNSGAEFKPKEKKKDKFNNLW